MFSVAWDAHKINQKNQHAMELEAQFHYEGCVKIVESLHFDGKLTDVYYSDALQWCRDCYLRGE